MSIQPYGTLLIFVKEADEVRRDVNSRALSSLEKIKMLPFSDVTRCFIDLEVYWFFPDLIWRPDSSRFR